MWTGKALHQQTPNSFPNLFSFYFVFITIISFSLPLSPKYSIPYDWHSWIAFSHTGAWTVAFSSYWNDLHTYNQTPTSEHLFITYDLSLQETFLEASAPTPAPGRALHPVLGQLFGHPSASTLVQLGCSCLLIHLSSLPVQEITQGRNRLIHHDSTRGYHSVKLWTNEWTLLSSKSFTGILRLNRAFKLLWILRASIK